MFRNPLILFFSFVSLSGEARKTDAPYALISGKDTINVLQKKYMKMKIEIWSDVMCPFCYIGKRNFEAALAQFPDRDNLEIEWKSFQLDPSIPEVPLHRENIYQFVAARKGISYEQSVRMHQQVVQMAKNAGLEYHFDKALVTNSRKAHRLIQLAKIKGLGEKAEERLFFAYFTQGKNLADTATLIALGNDIGLTDSEVKEALTNPIYERQAEEDGQEAYGLGAKGSFHCGGPQVCHCRRPGGGCHA